eukprot:TRINITY_DN25717_c0_g1_i1.p1 TRINITY_DN25717_c0_g1~~TRINITY_DN25717_c0_g1_i1.p1  ORF type:complete len:200 (+),score=36.40 TRINITY_DN25717_c0_g1_i1:1600-2199(+)
MDAVSRGACMHWAQLVATCALPRSLQRMVLPDGRAGSLARVSTCACRSLEILIGGWSIGSHPAVLTASQLEAAGFCVRALFMLDGRLQYPMALGTSAHRMLQRQAASHFRLAAPNVEFSSPLYPCVMLGEDQVRSFGRNEELAARRGLRAVKIQTMSFSDFSHFDIGVAQAWDVQSYMPCHSRGLGMRGKGKHDGRAAD